MNYLLDTNICIYLIKKEPYYVLEQFKAHPIGEIGVSTITIAELQYGVQNSQHVAQNQRSLEQFLAPLEIVDFDYTAAVNYGKIRAALKRQGIPIGPLDMLIAAQALTLDITLVTNNVKEFSRVPDLKITNWVGE
jgi:tRNA(fMet)-specific endonuclease VapC